MSSYLVLSSPHALSSENYKGFSPHLSAKKGKSEEFCLLKPLKQTQLTFQRSLGLDKGISGILVLYGQGKDSWFFLPSQYVFSPF